MSEEIKQTAALEEEKAEDKEIIEDKETTEETPLIGEDLIKLKSMAEAGLFYGKSKQKTHPKMKPYVLTTRNGVEIIDIAKTTPKLQEAADFLKEIKDNNKGQILIVGTQPGIKDLVFDLAKTLESPYVTNKWVGGTLTNLSVIRKRVDYLKKIREEEASGQLRKYNKKELSKINQEKEKMKWLFSGIENMTKLPVAILIVNPVLHDTAVKEASKVGIPIVAVVSTDGNPQAVQYPIPANDNAKPAIEFIFKFLKDNLQSGI